MSSIGGTSEASLTLQLFFQNAAQTTQSQPVAGTPTIATSTAAIQGGSTNSTGSTGLQQQVLAAVQSAVENFNTTDPSGTLQSLLSTIGQTIAQTLQSAGVTPTQGHGHHHHHHGAGAAGSSGSSGSDSSSSTDASGSTASTSSSTTATTANTNVATLDNGSTPPTIDQILAQAGQDPNTIKQSLINAIENPGTGDSSIQDVLAQFFQGLPSGSAVDVQA